jgi:general secretion pathway protein F
MKPLYGPIFVRANLRDFFESLALMLEAGVPMLEALPAAIATVIDGDIRSELTRVRHRVEQRETFAAALETEAIGSFYKELAAWLPRVVYALVAIKIGMGVFSSGGVGPRVPPQL